MFIYSARHCVWQGAAKSQAPQKHCVHAGVCVCACIYCCAVDHLTRRSSKFSAHRLKWAGSTSFTHKNFKRLVESFNSMCRFKVVLMRLMSRLSWPNLQPLMWNIFQWSLYWFCSYIYVNIHMEKLQLGLKCQLQEQGMSRWTIICICICIRFHKCYATFVEQLSDFLILVYINMCNARKDHIVFLNAGVGGQVFTTSCREQRNISSVVAVVTVKLTLSLATGQIFLTHPHWRVIGCVSPLSASRKQWVNTDFLSWQQSQARTCLCT